MESCQEENKIRVTWDDTIKNCYVYLHYTKDTEKLFYVGIGTHDLIQYHSKYTRAMQCSVCSRNYLWRRYYLKHGRTVHSLVKAMTRYEDNRFVFISPEELEMPVYIKDKIKSYSYYETTQLEQSLRSLDLLYMTRIQRERFTDAEEYERLKDTYILDKEKMEHAKEDMLVLHPLPRVNEISTDVDDDERAVYFKQATYGMYVRMALIIKLLGIDIND